MHERVSDVMRKEVIRLINLQRRELLEQLIQTPDFLRSNKQDQQQRSFNREDIEQWLEILKGEAYKVERVEVTFAVVGTMKAGKSTTINAIVGTEVLPNRNQPMTTLPTVIRHSSGKREPELTFPNPKPFNEIIERLRADLQEKERNKQLDNIPFCATDDGRELVYKILEGSLGEVRQTYKGTDEIFGFLKYINDIWRLCSSNSIDVDIDMYLDEYNEIHEFPAIEIEFFHLRDQDSELGKFTLIDTPGPNEAGQTFLKHIMHEQLEQASAVLAILDYTQLNAEADAEMRRALEEIADLTDNRLFVLVNKFDQKDRHGMNTEELRSYVVKHLLEGQLGKDRVHPVSSKYGYLANRALCELSLYGRLPDYNGQPWVEDFGKLALGACWESEIEDEEEVRYRAAKLWKNSLFDKPLTEVIKRGSENASLISLRSAIAKMMDFDKKIVDGIKVRQIALNSDIQIVEQHIKSLEQDIALVKEARDDARQKIDEGLRWLQMKINKLFTQCEEAAKKEIQTVFQSHTNDNWIVRRLKGYVDLQPINQSKSLNFNSKGYNDFETEAEAKQFVNSLIEEVSNYLQPLLDEMQQTTQGAVDTMSQGIWDSVNTRLDQVLKAAEVRLHETFSLSLEFPKTEVRSVKVNFSNLRQGAVREDVISKTGTRQERKWYTLWCRKHEVTYQYQQKIYRVYTEDIAKQLQSLLEEDNRQIRTLLDKFVQTEFSKTINTHFYALADYLERFRGDLLDAKRDQELENDRLDKLQAAMKLMLTIAVEHRKAVQSLQQEIPDHDLEGSTPELMRTIALNENFAV